MTRAAFENAMVVVMATRRLDERRAAPDRDGPRASTCRLTIDDFQKVSDRIPFLADLKPSGKYVMEDLHHVGGTPAVMKYLLEKGLARRRLPDGHRQDDRREPRATLPGLDGGSGRSSSRSRSRSRESGHIRILRGNLCPDGAVAKITGKEGLVFTGPANVLRLRRRHAARRWSRRRSRRAT